MNNSNNKNISVSRLQEAIRTPFAGILILLGVVLAVGTTVRGLSGQNAVTAVKVLTLDESRELVENVPEVRQARSGFDRPSVELVETSELAFTFLAQRGKTRGYPSGLIGHYEVDRRTGRIWREIDRRNEIKSFLLSALSQQFLGPSQAATLVEIRSSSGILETIEKSTSPLRYSIWNLVLGETSKQSALRPPGVTSAVLAPAAAAGQFLMGLQLGGDDHPLVEAYTGANDRVVELYVETVPTEQALSALFGRDFVQAVSSTEPEQWVRMFGPELLIRQTQHPNLSALYVDSPRRGFSVCSYRRFSAGTPEKSTVIFVDFYLPNQPSAGETLPDSIKRRLVTCLQDSSPLDR